MRIISGAAKGIRLHVPRGEAVRPTGGRVREAIFSVLGDMAGARVFDLFAGTGALGLEALSRGADAVTCVESDPRHAAVIRKNIELVKSAHESLQEGGTRILRMDVRQIPVRLKKEAQTADIIFADPPYDKNNTGTDAEDLVSDAAFAEWARGAIIVLEHSIKTNIASVENIRWAIQKQKTYGDTAISFLKSAAAGNE